MADKIIDSYGTQSLSYDLLHNEDTGRWTVICWKDDELHWEVYGRNEGGVSNGVRTTGGKWVNFDETMAREEFNRWRNQ